MSLFGLSLSEFKKIINEYKWNIHISGTIVFITTPLEINTMVRIDDIHDRGDPIDTIDDIWYCLYYDFYRHSTNYNSISKSDGQYQKLLMHYNTFMIHYNTLNTLLTDWIIAASNDLVSKSNTRQYIKTQYQRYRESICIVA